MNFDDSPDEAAFRAEVVAFLDAHAKRKERDGLSSDTRGEVRDAVEAALRLRDAGEARIATREAGGQWTGHQWL